MSERKPVLKLDKPVGAIKVLMTDQGFSSLRAAQSHFQELVKERSGNDVFIPYSTTIHMALKQFCETKGIEVKHGQEKPD